MGLRILAVYCLLQYGLYLIPTAQHQQRMAIPPEPMDSFLSPFYLATVSLLKHLLASMEVHLLDIPFHASVLLHIHPLPPIH